MAPLQREDDDISDKVNGEWDGNTDGRNKWRFIYHVDMDSSFFNATTP